MRTRSLGTSGLEVSAVGLGCMPMSAFYGTPDIPEADSTLELAVDLGITFWDTAEVYGSGSNEELIGRTLERHRDKVVMATKFGVEPNYVMTGRPENAYKAIDGSLRRLRTDHIDLWYLHRVDPTVPIEETVGAMADIVATGKVRYLGLSEASADTLRRACSVHPIAALQSEWSLWSRVIEPEVLPVARELGIGIVPYSPLGRGLMTGKITDLGELPEEDHRHNSPRFANENFEHNRRLVEEFGGRAADLGCTPSQLAIAWLLAQGDDVVPIPGTKRRTYLAENAGAVDVVITPEEAVEIGDLMSGVAGARYGWGHAYGDSPALGSASPTG
jgi:aryl-alcohol dehydrogenase-like predicted oxidoreductase